MPISGRHFRWAFYIGYYLLNVALASELFAVAVTFPMALVVAFALSQSKSPYLDVDEMVVFMMYLFFVIEPLQAIHQGRIGTDGPVSSVVYTNGEIAMAMAIGTVFYATYLLTRKIFQTRKRTISFYQMEGDYKAIIIFAVVVAAFLILLPLQGGLSGTLAPRYERLMLQEDATSSSTAALAKAFQGLVAMGVILLAASWRRLMSVTTVLLVIALIIDLICFNPFNAARFALLQTYIPLAFVLFRGRINVVSFYIFAMVGIFILFPILNITTRFGVAGVAEQDIDILADSLKLKFIDVFDILVSCVHYVNLHGYDYGQKTLANIVTFYPRAWWPDKPVIGGLDVGNHLLYSGVFGTANVSQIIAADGYMDFGLIGVVLMGGLCGYIFYLLLRNRNVINGHDLFGYSLIAALPILIRGPIAAVITVFLMQALLLMAARVFLASPVVPGPAWRLHGMGVFGWRRAPVKRPKDPGDALQPAGQA